jgi:uncharacterized membrane protein (UPF0127 family)
VFPRRLQRLPRTALPEGEEVIVADSPLARLLGLAWLDEVPIGCALLFPRCRCIHTFGMRFPIDVDFLDSDGRVLRRIDELGPRRVAWCRRAAAVLERPAA